MKSILIISFLFVLNTSMVYANDCVDPKVPSQRYEIEANITGEIESSKLGLKFTVRNISNERLKVPQSIFDRKSIQLSLVSSFSLSPRPLVDQTYIHPHMPWGEVILDPGEEYSEIINLNEGFKSLSKDLNRSSVVVFWRVGSESGSNDLCYEEGG